MVIAERVKKVVVEEKTPVLGPHVAIGVFSMHMLYLSLRYQLPASNGGPLYCYQIVTGIAYSIRAALGIHSWYIKRSCHQMAAERMYSRLESAKWLALFSLTYHIWSFGMSILIDDVRKTLLFIHHIIAAAGAHVALEDGILGYYAIYFMGLTEIPSVFLVLVDMGRIVPPVPDTVYDILTTKVSVLLFIVTSVYYRLVVWFYPVTTNLISDVQNALTKENPQRLVLYLLPGFLSMLQILWLFQYLQLWQSFYED